MTTADYNTVAYTNDAGGITYNIEKQRWNPETPHRRNKTVLLTGTFYQALDYANQLTNQQKKQEEAPF